MNCTINWNLSGTRHGTRILSNGEILGSDYGNILLDIPENIKIVAAVRPNDIYRFLAITPSQKSALRTIIAQLPKDTIFSSDGSELYEIAINILESR